VDLKRFVRVLRRHWLFIALIVIASVASAGALVWVTTPRYTARIQLFVSTPSTPANLSLTYQGGLFSQQRVLSYSRIMASPPVVSRVIKQLNLPLSVVQVQREIHASVPVDTVLIDVSVDDSSAARAAAIANALGTQFPQFARTLEKPQNGASPVRVTLTSPAAMPTSASYPRKKIDLAAAAVLGLLLGIGLAAFRTALET
jgi:capsular polysaccharide biosynthesis protein